MASSTPHVIVLQTNEEGAERPVLEGLAHTTTIKPGHLVCWSSGELVVHADDDALAAPMFAVENPFAEVSSGANIDHAYAADELVRYVWAQPGDLIYAWLETANNATKGAALTSDGAGGLQLSPTAGAVIAWADEDLNNTTGSQARLRVRVA
jgi:hypothetical protein